MLAAMGFDTGIDFARLLPIARRLPAIVGHVVPGVEGIYDRHHYNDERREWLTALAAARACSTRSTSSLS